MLRILDLTTRKLAGVRKRDPRKVSLASVVKIRTCVGNARLARRLMMGHDRSVSRLIRQATLDPGPESRAQSYRECCHARTDPIQQ